MVVQLWYNFVDCEIEGDYLEMICLYGIVVCLWSLFGQGFFIGKYICEDGFIGEFCVVEFSWFEELYLIEENFDVYDEFDVVVGEVDVMFVQMVFVWFMYCDGVIVFIVGVCMVEQLIENFEVVIIDFMDEQVDCLIGVKFDFYVGF